MAEVEKDRCLKLTKELMKFSKLQDETRKSQAVLETYSAMLAEKNKYVSMRLVPLIRFVSATHNVKSSEKFGG